MCHMFYLQDPGALERCGGKIDYKAHIQQGNWEFIAIKENNIRKKKLVGRMIMTMMDGGGCWHELNRLKRYIWACVNIINPKPNEKHLNFRGQSWANMFT